MKQLTEKQARRFWAKVQRGAPSECWLWIGSKLLSGYGSFAWDCQKQRAHRVSWVIHNGRIPRGKLVCHHCDTPLCVNPAHLFLGTDADNVRDKVAKGRSCAGTKHFKAKLTDAQVLEIWRSPRVKVKALAKQYGVTRFTIESIRYRKHWKHLTDFNHRRDIADRLSQKNPERSLRDAKASGHLQWNNSGQCMAPSEIPAIL